MLIDPVSLVEVMGMASMVFGVAMMIQGTGRDRHDDGGRIRGFGFEFAASTASTVVFLAGVALVALSLTAGGKDAIQGTAESLGWPKPRPEQKCLGKRINIGNRYWAHLYVGRMLLVTSENRQIEMSLDQLSDDRAIYDARSGRELVVVVNTKTCAATLVIDDTLHGAGGG